MADDKLAGKAEELKGKIKAKAGDATDDHSLQAEGMGDQVSGNAKQAAGEVKESLGDNDRSA